MNAKELYAAHTKSREKYVQSAIRQSYVTVPSLYSGEKDADVDYTSFKKGMDDRYNSDDSYTRPHSNIGRDGVNTLSATIVSTLFPLSQPWLQIKLKQEFEALVESKKDRKAIEDNFNSIEDSIQEIQDEIQLINFLNPAIQRNLIEGQNVIHLWLDDNSIVQKRLIPLGKFVAIKSNKKLLYIIIQDTTKIKNKTYDVYTKVDYTTKQVSRFVDDGNRKTDTITEEHSDSYTYFSSSNLSTTDYEYSYVSELLPDLEFYNRIKYNIKIGIDLFSKINIAYSQGSGILPQTLKKLRPGDYLAANVQGDGSVAGLGVITYGHKVGELAFSVNLLSEIASTLNKQFAGLLSTQLSNDPRQRTATEIEEMARELNAFSSGIGQVYQSGLLQSLAANLFNIHKERQRRAGHQTTDILRAKVVAGNSQLMNIQNAQKLQSHVMGMLQMNPEYTQRINWDVYFKRISDHLSIETDDLLLESEPGAETPPQQGPQQ